MWRENAGDVDFAGNFWPMTAGVGAALFRSTAAPQRGVCVRSHLDVGFSTTLKRVDRIHFLQIRLISNC